MPEGGTGGGKEVWMRRRLSQRLQTSTLMLGYRHSVRGHYTPHCWCVFTCCPPQGACSVGPWAKHQLQTPTYCTALNCLYPPLNISFCISQFLSIIPQPSMTEYLEAGKKIYMQFFFWTFLTSASIWG